MVIGILALQGAFREHGEIFKKLNIPTLEVRTQKDLEQVEGLIIPGGESTTISKLLQEYNLDKLIIEKAHQGMPIFGTCAGAILLAKEIIGNTLSALGLMDISIKRNDYGRQAESFQKELDTKLGKIPGIFIRAPVIKEVRKEVEVLAEFNGNPVLVRQNNLLVATFHPELTNDTRIHQYFLEMVNS